MPGPRISLALGVHFSNIFLGENYFIFFEKVLIET